MKPGLSGGIQATAPSACPRSATGASPVWLPAVEESCEWEKSLISRFWGSPYDNHYFESQSFIQVVKQKVFLRSCIAAEKETL